MTKRAVWIISLIVVLLSLGSVGYRLLMPARFDGAVWRTAEDEGGYLDRRTMMREVRRMLADGTIADRESALRILGNPDPDRNDDPGIWYYNLGGQHSSSGPETVSWLQLTFDGSGRLIQHQVTQDLLIPTRP